jgi:hypothetical protein
LYLNNRKDGIEMTETTNVGTPTPEGAGGNQPPVSRGTEQPIAGAPQSSQEFLDLKKRLDLTEKELRGLQSRQDKDKNETQRFMDEVKQQMASGKSFEEAEKAVTESRKAQEKDDLLYKIAQKVGVLGESSPTQATGNGASVTNDVAQVLSKAKLDANDAQVIDLIKNYGNDPVEFAMRVGEHKARMANSPQPSAASSPALQSAPPQSGPPSVEKLTGDYQKEMLAARGNKALAKGIVDKYRKMGVPTERVTFTV